MNYIPVHLLETLSVFYKEKTVARAAQAIHTTQPTVTRHLQQIQNHFQTNLFEVRGKRKVLSAFGENLARAALSRLGDLQTVMHKAQIDSEEDSVSPLLVVGRREILRRFFLRISLTRAAYLVPQGRAIIRQGILKQEPDLAITQELLDSAEYIRKKIFEDQMGALVPMKYVERGLNWMDAVRKASLPLCAYPNQEFVEGKEPQLVFEDWDFLETRIAAGQGWGVIPSSYVRSNSKDYKFFPLPNYPKQSFYLYYRKSLRNSDLVIKLLKE